MTARQVFTLASACGIIIQVALSQNSDFQVKQEFETTTAILKARVDSASSLAAMDSMKLLIDGVESTFVSKRGFLDRALYPRTFAGTIEEVRSTWKAAYDRIFVITVQGRRISDLEARLGSILGTIDSLTSQRNALAIDLRKARESNRELESRLRRVSMAVQAKDKLILALLDSMFLPYSRGDGAGTQSELEAVGRALERANIVSRLYQIGAENLRFTEVVQLQPQDFGPLLDQYSQFSGRWEGLRGKIVAAMREGTPPPPRHDRGTSRPTSIAGGAPRRELPQGPGSEVDSILAQWRASLMTSLWNGIAGEFAGRSVYLAPFQNGESFDASVRAYLDSARAQGKDVSVFVDEIWKVRIDKEWRKALESEDVLGPERYAALDRAVSEFDTKSFNTGLMIGLAVFAGLLVAAWYLLFKKRPAAAPSAPPPSTE